MNESTEYIVEVNENPTITMDGWNVRCDDMFIQREEIVRCRDCKFCMRYWGYDYCDFFSHVTNDPDGFCAWAERRNA